MDRLHLAEGCTLKLLEAPSVYQILRDELYELDHEAYSFLSAAARQGGAPDSEGDREFVRFCLDEGILTTTPPPLTHEPVEPTLRYTDALPSLRYLELQITGRCNLRCAHCYLGPASGTDLPADAVDRALGEFEAMQGLRVLLSGGEPLAHPGFSRINAALPAHSLRYVLFTNGTLLTPEIARGLNVHEVQISVDGLEISHDSLRGKGTHEKAIAAIGHCREAGLDVSVSTMIHAGNAREFPAMANAFAALGVRDWTVDAPSPMGAMASHPELALPPGQAGPLMEYGYGSGMHGGGSEGYGCGPHLMAVMPDGSVVRCGFYADQPVGSLTEGLAAAWPRVQRPRMAELACAAAPGCDAMDECRGGCRFRAEATGGPGAKDLYKCAIYDKI
jgi:radical SAM protein with 4Fe4S-binding SPASM domain